MLHLAYGGYFIEVHLEYEVQRERVVDNVLGSESRKR